MDYWHFENQFTKFQRIDTRLQSSKSFKYFKKKTKQVFQILCEN